MLNFAQQQVFNRQKDWRQLLQDMEGCSQHEAAELCSALSGIRAGPQEGKKWGFFLYKIVVNTETAVQKFTLVLQEISRDTFFLLVYF